MHFSRPQKCVLDNLSEKNSLQSCVQVGGGFGGGGGGWGGVGGGLTTSRSDAGSTTGKEAASSNTFLGHHRKCTFRGCKSAF